MRVILDTDLPADHEAIQMVPGVQYPISTDGRWAVSIPVPADPDVAAIDQQINDAIAALHTRRGPMRAASGTAPTALCWPMP